MLALGQNGSWIRHIFLLKNMLLDVVGLHCESDSDGFTRLKARLVTKGYKQKNVIDYLETFPTVCKITSISLLVYLAASHDQILYHLDVKNDILHSDLQEEVYIDQPPGCSSGKA